MVASSQQQHRCVFVGNIPYDATEERLIEICSEVGPVVSFRLVIDRETGKPKGYGFCEYKDEETALSARRNLQGYEINGRQLRVDFAENGKNADKTKELGRSGPGQATSVDAQKQVGGPANPAESSLYQPIGLHSAISAAAVMAGALGGHQSGLQSTTSSLLGQSALSSDPLTLHLAKMSRSQLLEILLDLKAMTTQNRGTAFQLLNARPQLSKALFQVQIMLGMVTPQVLQMPNLRQPPSQPTLQPIQYTQQGPQATAPSITMLPPIAHRAQTNLVPKLQESPFSVRMPKQVASSMTLNQQIQPTLVKHPLEIGTEHPAHSNNKIIFPNGARVSSILPHPPASDGIFLPGQKIPLITSEAVLKDAIGPARFPGNPPLVQGNNAFFNMQKTTIQHPKEIMSRPSKILKLDDGRSMTYPSSGLNVSNATVPGPSQAFLINQPIRPLPNADELQNSDKQVPQLSSDVESALLQQVLNLTPEQLQSLPPEQQRQVIQLQQALRRE